MSSFESFQISAIRIVLFFCAWSFATFSQVYADDADSFYQDGLSKYSERNFVAAEKAFSRAISIDSKMYKAYAYRGLLRSGTGDFKGAIQDYSSMIKLNPKVPHSYYFRGNAFGQLGDFQRAHDDYSEAIALDPRYSRAYYARGAVRERMQDYQRALTDFNKAVSIDPSLAAPFRRSTTCGMIWEPSTKKIVFIKTGC